MMGERRVDQGALFYEFCLERHVPQDHLLRVIDRFVDLAGIRAHLASYYSPIGRPSIDPELMIRMLLVGYCLGIRSERRLCDEVHLNLAYRWFCRLGLDGDVPDLDLLQKSSWSLPRERSSAPVVRERGPALHGRRSGRGRRLRGRCQLDQGRRQPAERDRRRQGPGPRGDQPRSGGVSGALSAQSLRRRWHGASLRG